MKRSELKRTTGLSARGKGGACPPRATAADLESEARCWVERVSNAGVL